MNNLKLKGTAENEYATVKIAKAHILQTTYKKKQ